MKSHGLTYLNTPQNHVFQIFLTTIGKLVQTHLVRQIEYMKVENEILRSKLDKQVRCTYQEKLKLMRYGSRIGGSIKHLIGIVNYSTYRRWVIGLENGTLNRKKIGRPRTTPQQVRELVIRMAKENLDWGYGRIMGELKKLHIKLSRNTIRQIMRENNLNPSPKRYEDSWDAYIKRTFATLYACDFLSKTIWTPLGIRTMNVLFFINMRTRKVHLAGVTDKPKRDWVVQKAKELEHLFAADDSKKLLIRDGDGKYSKQFDEVFKKHNTQVKRIPYRSPNLNPYAEGFAGTIQRECLDKFFIFGKTHFEYLLTEFIDYYNTQRPHSGLNNETISSVTDEIKCKSKLGGLIKHYYRE